MTLMLEFELCSLLKTVTVKYKPAVTVLFLNFYLCPSVMLDSLSCSVTFLIDYKKKILLFKVEIFCLFDEKELVLIN